MPQPYPHARALAGQGGGASVCGLSAQGVEVWLQLNEGDPTALARAMLSSLHESHRVPHLRAKDAPEVPKSQVPELLHQGALCSERR